MLFKQATLEAIKAGTVSLAFRKWKRPAAKEGSLIKTAIGLVKIEKISLITPGQIKAIHAKEAGYKDLQELQAALDKIPEGDIYKIAIHYYAADPRIVLRQQAQLSEAAYVELKTRLERLDQYSKTGAWTLQILLAIQDNRMLKAADLALKTGREKDWLKLNIRKLKNLGLTISHDPGYELSPLGKAYLAALS
jgi:hypothetical protein